MPSVTKRICNKCHKIVDSNHNCRDKQSDKNYNKLHRVNAKFYNGYEWRKKREQIKKRDGGLCQECLRSGRTATGRVVDHIKPIKDNYELRLDDSNLETLCDVCHNKKTAKENKERKDKPH